MNDDDDFQTEAAPVAVTTTSAVQVGAGATAKASLQSYLILPIQRLARYVLLLRQVRLVVALCKSMG